MAVHALRSVWAPTAAALSNLSLSLSLSPPQGTDGVTLCLFLSALWWPSTNLCAKLRASHCSSDSSLHWNVSSVLMGAPGQPAFPTKCTQYPVDALSILCAQLEFRLWAPWVQLADTCLGMALNTAKAKKYSSLSKRGSAEWLYLLHSAVLILVSLCLSAMPWSALHFHPAEHSFIGGCASPWVTEFPFWTPSKWFLWQDLSYLTYMVCL